MDTHIRAAAWLRIIWSSGLLLLALVILLAFFGIGALAGVIGGNDTHVAASWMMACAVFGSMFFGVLALPGLLIGWGLLNYRPWARILDIVFSIFDLIHFPLGTLVGGYSLWVMLQPETAELFEGRVPPGRYPAHF